MQSGKKNTRESGYDLLKRLILDTDLCCGCGGCVGVCPVDALEINPAQSYLPAFHEEKCIRCPLCYEVCPGQGYELQNFSEKINKLHNSQMGNIDPARGLEIGQVLGWATDEKIRSEGASGGIATAVMLHCLETGLADEVLVTTLVDGIPVPVLTNDIEVVKAARGTKYSPVPIMNIIDDVRRRPRKIVLIGSGCHLASWKMAEKRFKVLRDCVVLSMGFFCGGVQEIEALDAIADSLGVNFPDEVEFLGMREGDFPGNARYRDRKSGEIFDKPIYPAYDISIPFYTLNRCHVCPDNSAWLADMVLGDHHSNNGNDTAVTVRTERGLNILESACRMGRIAYAEMSVQDIQKGTSTTILASRVYPAISCIARLEKKGKPVPVFDLDHNLMFAKAPQYRKLQFLWTVKYRMIQFMASSWRLRFFRKYPYLMQHTGHFLYYFPMTLPGYGELTRIRRKILDRR